MGATRGTYGRRQEMQTGFLWGNVKGWGLGKSRYRWEHNIKTDTKEIRWEGMDWIHLAQDWDKWQVLVNTAGYKGKNRTLLGYYTASSGNFLPMFWDNL